MVEAGLLTSWQRPHRLAAVVLLAAVLSLGALVGVASTVGFGRVLRQLVHPHWIWVPVALGCELIAYLSYTLAYREVARVERGPSTCARRFQGSLGAPVLARSGGH